MDQPLKTLQKSGRKRFFASRQRFWRARRAATHLSRGAQGGDRALRGRATGGHPAGSSDDARSWRPSEAARSGRGPPGGAQMSKLTEQGVRKVESKLEGADSNPVRVLIRPDLTREEGQALARSL